MRGTPFAAAAAVIACSACGGGTAASHFSNAGQLVPLTPRERAVMLRRHRSPHVYRLATLRRITIFRFGDSGRCYGATHDFHLRDVTPATVPSVFGGYTCGTTSRPVMDFSIVGASRRRPGMHIERLMGVAADEIRSIQILSRTGRVLASAPVRRNVYAMWSPPPGAVSLRPVTREGWLLPAIP